MSAASNGGRRLVNALIVVVSLVVSLLVLEFAVRALFGDKVVLFPRNHAEARYGDYVIRRIAPGISFWHQSIDGRWHFTINRQGFRADRDYSYDKPPGVVRVLALGDSHTEGFEVAQHEVFTSVLEGALRRRGVNAEVLNAGVSGFGTAEQLVFLENEGLRYKPDVVVVAFYANDFSDSARSGLFRLEHGQLVEGAKVYAPAVRIVEWTLAVPGLKWLGENSYAYSMLFNAAWDLMKPSRAASREYAVKVGTVTTSVEDLTGSLLQRMSETAKRHGAVIVLVDVPEYRGATGYSSSLEPAFRSRVRPLFDHLLWSEQYLAGLSPGQAAHVPHGHRHINAEAHRRLGLALDELLGSRFSGTGPSALAESAR